MINSFTFYKDYYNLIDTLPNEDDKKEILIAILDYMFKDETPNLEGHNKAIFTTLSYQLDVSKKQTINGMKGGRPKTQTITQIKPNNKPKVKAKEKQIYISNFLFLISNLNISNLDNKEYIYNLLNEYFEIRIKKKYILNETVVKRLINKLNEYGTTDENKIEIITNAINGAWKDFYPLKEESNKNYIDKAKEEFLRSMKK